ARPARPAVADAVGHTPRPARSSRRRVLARSAVVVAIAAVALIAVLLWPSGGQHTSVLDRALAAIGDDRVMHVVLRTPSGFQFVELPGGPTISPTAEVDLCNARSSRRGHAIVRERGQVISETLIPEDDHGPGEL